MAGGGKGGSQTVEQKIPQYIEDASKKNISLAEQIANIGYMPYYGPDVAAATPQEMASWRGANDAARAFGMDTAKISVPKAQDFGGGVMGYSSGPLYDRAVAELKDRQPGIFDAYQSLFSRGGGGVAGGGNASGNIYGGKSLEAKTHLGATPQDNFARLWADTMGGYR